MTDCNNPDDLYRILQVDPAADAEVIQAAYRVLARQAHPDVTGSDERMKRLNAAWEVLKDASRRTYYDRQREVEIALASKNRHVEHSQYEGTTRDSNWAGPPPGQPYGTVLPFGRYKDWSIGEVARQDPDWLEWLANVPSGRRFKEEISLVVADVRAGRELVPARRHRDYFG